MEQQMTGRTMSMTMGAHRGYPLSPRAQATRSLWLAERITDPAQRREAMQQHFAQFATPPGRSCPVRPD